MEEGYFSKKKKELALAVEARIAASERKPMGFTPAERVALSKKVQREKRAGEWNERAKLSERISSGNTPAARFNQRREWAERSERITERQNKKAVRDVRKRLISREGPRPQQKMPKRNDKNLFVSAVSTRSPVSKSGVKRLRKDYTKTDIYITGKGSVDEKGRPFITPVQAVTSKGDLVSTSKEYKKFKKETRKGIRKDNIEKRSEKVREANKKMKDSKVGKYVGKKFKQGETKLRQAEKKAYTLARKELKPRRVMRKGKIEVRMPKKTVGNYWEPGRQFFKEELEQERRNMFFE